MRRKSIIKLLAAVLGAGLCLWLPHCSPPGQNMTGSEVVTSRPGLLPYTGSAEKALTISGVDTGTAQAVTTVGTIASENGILVLTFTVPFLAGSQVISRAALSLFANPYYTSDAATLEGLEFLWLYDSSLITVDSGLARGLRLDRATFQHLADSLAGQNDSVLVLRLQPGLGASLFTSQPPQLSITFSGYRLLGPAYAGQFQFQLGDSLAGADTAQGLAFHWEVTPGSGPGSLTGACTVSVALLTATGQLESVFDTVIFNWSAGEGLWSGGAALLDSGLDSTRRQQLTDSLAGAQTVSGSYLNTVQNYLQGSAALIIRNWPALTAVAAVRQEITAFTGSVSVPCNRTTTLDPALIIPAGASLPLPVVKIITSLYAPITMRDTLFEDSLQQVSVEFISRDHYISTGQRQIRLVYERGGTAVDTFLDTIARTATAWDTVITVKIGDSVLSRDTAEIHDTTEWGFHLHPGNRLWQAIDSFYGQTGKGRGTPTKPDSLCFGLRLSFPDTTLPALRVDSLRFYLEFPGSIKNFKRKTETDTTLIRLPDSLDGRSLWPGRILQFHWTGDSLENLFPGLTSQEVLVTRALLTLDLDTTFPPFSTSLDYAPLFLQWKLADWVIDPDGALAAGHLDSLCAKLTNTEAEIEQQALIPGREHSVSVDITQFLNHLLYFPQIVSAELNLQLLDGTVPAVLVYQPGRVQLSLDYQTRVRQ